MGELFVEAVEPVGGGALLEEVCHWGWGGRAYLLPSLPVCILFSFGPQPLVPIPPAAIMDSPYGDTGGNKFFLL